MSDADQGVSVTILGTKFTVRSDRDEAYVRSLETYLNGRLEQFVRGRSAPLLQSLILTALNIADELFRERDTRRELLEEIVRRTDALLGSLEESEQMALPGVEPVVED